VKIMFLAAGMGTRLKPLTDHMPKCMVPVMGKPLLEHNIVWARQYGFSDVIINLHYQPQAIRDYFQDGSQWGVHITYSDEAEILGTAGAVRRVMDLLDGPVCIWYGDNLSTCSLPDLVEFHRQQNAAATIVLFRREDTGASGIVAFDENKRVTRFLEKPTPEEVFSKWVNAGIYILEPEVIAAIPEDRPSDFSRDIFPALLAAGKPLAAYCLERGEGLWWIDTPQDLMLLQQKALPFV
jgi:mannose-1-phosphate guanylyltransferase / phosphomannomutase